MPKSPSWYVRLPEILAVLRRPDAPRILDRAAIEVLFDVRRRQAIRILGTANGYQVGKTFVIERAALLRFLEGLEQVGAPRQARARTLRVANALTEARNHVQAQQVEIRPAPEVLNSRTVQMPAAVELVAPGKLQISYDRVEDLLARIVELVSSAAADFAAFRRIYGERE